MDWKNHTKKAKGKQITFTLKRDIVTSISDSWPWSSYVKKTRTSFYIYHDGMSVSLLQKIVDYAAEKNFDFFVYHS